jgi:FAD/FMN-containing dehydrogenase
MVPLEQVLAKPGPRAWGREALGDSPPSVPTHRLSSLAGRLAGEFITPDHVDYDTARGVWNGMIEKRPAAIARCADSGDVSLAVRLAAEHGLPLAVRGGGHNVAGTAAVDDGL